jgi:hypothetical protein
LDEEWKMSFKKAIKEQSKLRCAMFGPSGSGKTYSALAIASGIGGSIAVIDSERSSSAKYADRFDFDLVELDKKTIDEYIKYITDAGEAGYNVLIIDSLSHAWKELLQEVEKIAQTHFRGNTFSAWSKGTPRQQRFLDAILRYPGHVIVTMRSKTEYVLDTVNGKTSPKKIGMAPDQGKDIEYEFDMLIELNQEHTAVVTKDRTGQFQDTAIEKPGVEFGRRLIEWLNNGAPESKKQDPPKKSALERMGDELAAATTPEQVMDIAGRWEAVKGKIHDVQHEAGKKVISKRFHVLSGTDETPDHEQAQLPTLSVGDEVPAWFEALSIADKLRHQPKGSTIVRDDSGKDYFRAKEISR